MSVVDFVNFLTLQMGEKKKWVIIASVVNGLCMTILMYSLQIGLKETAVGGAVSIRGLALFICALVAFYVTQLYAIRTASGAAYSAIEGMELGLIDKLRRIDYPTFKSISPADIYAALGGDKNSVISASRSIVTAFSSAISIVIAVLYMATISVTAVVLILLECVLIIFLNKANSNTLAKRFEADSRLVSSYMGSLEDLIQGFAELKMNNQKSEEFYQKKVQSTSKNKTEGFKATEIYWVQMLVISQSALFLPLGLIVFIVPAMSAGVQVQSLVEILAITLILIGPAGFVAGFVNAVDLAGNTLMKMRNIDKQLDETASGEAGEDLSALPETPDFLKLKIDHLGYTYPGSSDGFTLTVRDFRLNKGELIIIKGGNGSGKSTFMRLFAGLLLPSAGDIMVDGVSASSMKKSDYRSMFSIILSDFHLFDSFYGFEADAKELDYWVRKLDLQEQFKQYNSQNRLPTTALSSGQRKRMALLSAILEKKKILLLDEVAADFDPEFRTRYYREIIPELKAAGRTMLLVSHDDRYFDIADRVVEFREGSNIT